MKAIQFKAGKPISDPDAAITVDVPKPKPTGRDVLVRVEAVALNPVDTKVRPKAGADDAILGYDAAGTVVEIGDGVEHLAVGDAVYYAGDIRRPGSNAEFQLVDERIVGNCPVTLDAAAAAALPLTALTAYESLFDRLGLDPDGADAGKTLLIIGGAGGVGSIGIQLAKSAGLIVIATASRDESASWCRDLGADHVINHNDPLRPQIEGHGLANVDFIANFNNTTAYWDTMGDLIAPQGKIVLIVEEQGPLLLGGDYKRKSVTVVWELMFTRSMFTTADIGMQREILNRVAMMVDEGRIRSTVDKVTGLITAENILAAHRAQQTGRIVGKQVLAGWE